MARVLIKNGTIVTVDPKRQIHSDGFVAVDGARIVAVGPATQSPAPNGFD